VRTTLTIDDDLMRELKETAHREGLSFKQMVNRALRRGLRALEEPARRKRYRCPVFSMGVPRAELDKALALADALEDQEIMRKLDLRK
jgi:hypothetical protein